MNSNTADFDQQLLALLPRLWRFALTLAHSRPAAEELVQATCERALNRSHQWRPDSHLDRWTFSIMHSIWNNELRSRHIRKEQTFSDSEAADWVEPGHAPNKLLFYAVIHAVEALPENLRATVLLVYVEGYAYWEAAEILDIPIGTVMSRLASARLTLARQFPAETRSTIPQNG